MIPPVELSVATSKSVARVASMARAKSVLSKCSKLGQQVWQKYCSKRSKVIVAGVTNVISVARVESVARVTSVASAVGKCRE